MQPPVLFISENSLERAENLKAVYDAYDGLKEFKQGWDDYGCIPRRGYSAVVVDTMPPYMPYKDGVKIIFIGHGITGGKLYAFDKKKTYLDPRSKGQIDYAVCASTMTRSIIASQAGIPVERVLSLGMPRTDMLVKEGKSPSGPKVYLYLPTFREPHEEAPLPSIDWNKLDSLLHEDELFVVKRHYFTDEPLVTSGVYPHILELDNHKPSGEQIVQADVVVTDFSSVVFDAYVAGKPVILATDGMEGYLHHRGMYMQYPESYGTRWMQIEGNEEFFVDFLRMAAETGMDDGEKQIRDYVANKCDGESSRRVAELVAQCAEDRNLSIEGDVSNDHRIGY